MFDVATAAEDYERLYPPSLSVSRLVFQGWCGALAGIVAPTMHVSPLRNPLCTSTSVIDRATISCLRLYNPTSCPPHVIRTSLCNLAPSPASAYISSESLFSRGVFIVTPSYGVGFKYCRTWSAVHMICSDGSVAPLPKRLTWRGISGLTILPINRSSPISD